ncbi:MAG: DUF167 domain-containing protein [Alphaproteobacteria bacterium]|nr:DUF167 domain-containing protein [Alphaproteobacteria bacterium]
MPNFCDPSPFDPAPEGVRVRVRLTPKAAAERLGGLHTDPDGRCALKVAVTAPAENGRANAALIALLAKAWRMPKTAISLIAGNSSRTKTMLVAGEPRALLATLSRTLVSGPRE